ncbi:MAG: hypothetical protein H6799_01410 [Candidatus Nomurabacteria bacterium]|nr:MAG: hypothetical protein H6799_01410 [Candidatus Nomurabacteria bacterium]HRV76085.1 hypothetical protein [Candidatus Saccharimonadales bacterium]
MNPQLPKVEVGPIEGDVQGEINKAYKEAPTGEVNPQRDPSELLRAGGSVGVEAGLTNFEAVSDGKTTDDNSSDDNSVDDVDDGTSPVAPAIAKPAIGSAVVAQTPAVADDKDDIEKEWISKAKRIVEQTKFDPYLQERAVSRLQADYMKKRFNKDIKLPEGDG